MNNFPEIKIIRSKRKSIAIAIKSDGTVKIRAPKYIPNFIINTFVKYRAYCNEKLMPLL